MGTRRSNHGPITSARYDTIRVISRSAHKGTYGPTRGLFPDSGRFEPNTFTCARFSNIFAHVIVLGKEHITWAALDPARKIGRPHLRWIVSRGARSCVRGGSNVGGVALSETVSCDR